MTCFALIASGQSVTQELVDGLRGERRIVVNDAWKLAPDAEALCANDAAWWNENLKNGLGAFQGRRFCTRDVRGVEKVRCELGIETGSNSALLGLHVAIKVFGATRIVLYGVDMHGTHYFGRHKTLPNTAPHRFEIFKRQFAEYAKRIPKGIEVLNASPISTLACFPFLISRS